MPQIKNPFTDHPQKVGETYFEHFGVASSFGLRMISGGLACLLHGFFPFLFETTGSRKVSQLHDVMVVNRRRDGKCKDDHPCDDLNDNPHAGFAHAVFAEL